MIWFLIGIVIVVYKIIDIWCDYWDTLFEKIVLSILAILVAFICCCMMHILCGGFIPSKCKQLKLYNEEKIYSVKDNIGTEGKFILGFGNVESELKYYYMIKENLGYKIKNINANDVNIIETESNPKIKEYHYEYKNKWLNLIACDVNIEYVLEIPKNTIKIEYKIDME